MSADKEYIKQRLSMNRLLDHYRIEVSRTGKAVCPFHDDHDPSMSIKEDYFKCFVCGKGGDVFSFIQDYENCDFKKAVTIAGEIAGVEVGGYRIDTSKTIQRPSKQKIQPEEISETDQKIYRFFHYLLGDIPDICRSYLNSRCISDKTIKAAKIKGIESRKHSFSIKTQLEKKFNTQELIESGIFTEKGLRWFRPSIIFPYFKNNKLIYFSNRFIDEDSADKKKRFINMTGAIQDYYLNLRHKKLYVFESIIDALSYYQDTGIDNFIAVGGTSGFNIQQLKKIRKETSARLVLLTDIDGAGENTIREIKKAIAADKTGIDNVSIMRFKNFLQYKGITPDAIKFHNITDYNDYLKLKILIAYEDYEERAAIMEYMGGLDRDHAEQKARELTGYSYE